MRGVLVVAFLFPSLAAAQSAAPVADALFRDAQALMAQGRWAEACPKLAESQRLDPALGTLLNLARCHEHEGKTATAWSEFVDAQAKASRAGEEDRADFARGRVAELAPTLYRVTVSAKPVAGLEVSLDGVPLAPVSLGISAPLDPGPHHVSARAPGKRPFERDFEVPRTAGQLEVIIALEDIPPPPRPPPVRKETSSLGWLMGGTGIVVTGIGAVFGVMALDKKAQVDALCTDGVCQPGGAALAEDARTAGWISTAGIGVGAAAILAGLYLVLGKTRGAMP